MKKQLPFTFAVTLFTCGLFVGLIGRSDSKAQQGDSPRLSGLSSRTGALAAEISTDLVCLQRLRAGETNEAIAVLERRTDEAIAVLGEGLRLIPAADRDPLQLKAIRIYKHYRGQFPLTNSPAYPFKTAIPQSVKDGIVRAYALVPDENVGR